MNTARKARMFKALGSPQRLALFERLRRAEAKCRTTDADAAMCVCDLADCVDVGLSTVSHHLKELKDAGLVTTEKRGQWVFCSVNGEALSAIEAFAQGDAPSAGRKGSAR